MKISLDDLKNQPHERLLVSFKESLAGLEAVKPVIGSLTLVLGSWGVAVSGRVQTLLKLTCDRCLKAYFQSLTVDIDERLVFNLQAAGVKRERELGKDDFVEKIPDSGILDISDIVYQAVTLATPAYCICGSQCPGPPLSPGAGISSAGNKLKPEADFDPRWKNLKTLFPKEDSGEIS